MSEFYVGYLPKSPPGIAGRIRRAVVLLFVVGLAVAATIVVAQKRFDPGTFEFGVVKRFEGVIVERPYPMLIADGGETHWLVAFGKRGASEAVAGLDGARVMLEGSRVFNDERRMIELAAGSIERLDDGSVPPRLESASLGEMSLVGEVVDAKCHLGVMKPGRQKPHKACAIRCIAGGIPPVLRVETPAGELFYLLLVDRERRPVNERVLHLVAEPVRVSGEVVREGDQLLLLADPDKEYERL